MLSLDDSAQRRPASRRLLGILCSSAGKLPLTISAMLAMLIAAGAQPHALAADRAGRHAATEGHALAYSRLGPRVLVQPDDIVKDGVVIGRDPDPFIRGEMLRHYGVGGP